MALKDIVTRRLEQLGLGPIEAAVRGGLERTYIRDIVEGRKKSVRNDKLHDLAWALQLRPDALSEGYMVSANPDADRDEDPPLLTRVPVISWVSAGDMARDYLVDEELDAIYLANLPPGDWFALRVVGTSMDRISPPDSTIIANKRDKHLVSNGCYVIADDDGMATYKRYRPDPDRFEPVSTQDSHKTIFPEQEPLVVGRVHFSILRL